MCLADAGLTIGSRGRCLSAVETFRALALAVLASGAGVLTVAPRGDAQIVTETGISSGVEASVRFRGQTLFTVRSRLGDLSPAERAAAIEGRLAKIASGPSSTLDSVRVVERERTSDLVAGETLVLSVTDADASPTGRTREQLAADYAVQLSQALRDEFSGRSLRGIGIGLALTAITTVLLFLLFRVTGNLFPRLAREVRSWQGTRIRGVRFQRVEFISAARLTAAAIRMVRALRVVLMLVALAIYVQLVLGFFPWTRGVAGRMFDYGWSAVRDTSLSVLGYLPKVLYIAIIVVIARFVMRATKLFFDAVERSEIHLPSFHAEWADPTYKIVRFLIMAFATVIAFPYLPGSQSPAFRGVSIFFGVLLSLGSTSAVANIVAGIVLTYMIPFRPGDRVKIADTVGDVVESNLLVVRVRTIKNVEITIPNAAVLASHIVNYSTRAENDGLILCSTVTIGYDAPWRTVHELLITAAARTRSILEKPAPFVLQTALNDFFVSYEINAYTDQASRMAVTYGELHQNIQDEFAKAGVEIMSPHYMAARDGNTIAIPADQRPSDYEAPAFRVNAEVRERAR